MSTLLPHAAPDPGTLLQEGTLADRWIQVIPQGLHWCLYHVLLFIGFLVAGRWALHKLPLLPYRENLRRIDDLLDAMSARTKVTASPSVWEPARWVYSLFTERVKELEREPWDPRTVELAFLQILEEIQRGGPAMPGIARHHLSLPGTEITFVFDELDKLGSRMDPDEGRYLSLEHDIAVATTEQDRALKLRALLSDLKNILATAPARFIFIGGRNLHDEWLADQTTRQPLLTNIFNAEVYLPSLFTDRPARPEAPAQPSQLSRDKTLWLDRRIEEYVAYQHRRAERQYREWALKRLRASFGLTVTRLAPERFVATPREDSPALKLEVFACLGTTGGIEACCAASPTAISPVPKTIESHPLVSLLKRLVRLFSRRPSVQPEEPAPPGPESDYSSGEGEALLRDLMCFLTHRSMGNPKRLKELLAPVQAP